MAIVVLAPEAERVRAQPVLVVHDLGMRPIPFFQPQHAARLAHLVPPVLGRRDVDRRVVARPHDDVLPVVPVPARAEQRLRDVGREVVRVDVRAPRAVVCDAVAARARVDVGLGEEARVAQRGGEGAVGGARVDAAVGVDGGGVVGAVFVEVEGWGC